jgi:hypothetical protein
MKLCIETWLELWLDWSLYHDNASGHKALSVKQFLAQEPITEMEHPPYSLIWLQMTCLFPKNKVYLKGTKNIGY